MIPRRTPERLGRVLCVFRRELEKKWILPEMLPPEAGWAAIRETWPDDEEEAWAVIDANDGGLVERLDSDMVEVHLAGPRRRLCVHRSQLVAGWPDWDFPGSEIRQVPWESRPHRRSPA